MPFDSVLVQTELHLYYCKLIHTSDLLAISVEIWQVKVEFMDETFTSLWENFYLKKKNDRFNLV